MTRMHQPPTERPGLTGLGKVVSFLLVVGLVALGVFIFTRKSRERQAGPPAGPTAQTSPQTSQDQPQARPGDGPRTPDAPRSDEPPPKELAELATEVPKLDPAAPYQPKGDTVEIELSEYAGYSGLIAANGGLDPTENSVFFKDHGFKLKITLSEEESWSALNSGKMAASATTVDVLAVYGRQFQVAVPAQIGFSRGADGVVVRSDIKRINNLKGQILATSQFTEADFFIRYLAQEAGLGVNMLADLNTPHDPQMLNLVYCEDAFAAGDLFLRELQAGRNRLAGCVTWAPKTTDVVEASGGKAHLLTTNRNLLIVADILIVNRGFAQSHPKMVAGLADGLLKGNRMVRENPDKYLDVLVKAFNTGKDPVKQKNDLWDRASAKEELSRVHLSNGPENLAFFSGAIDAAGSYAGIYNSAAFAYGKELIPNPPAAERFLELSHLQALEQGGAFQGQQVAIAPIRTEGRTAAIEENPLLSKDIRFYFKPNSSELDMANQQNLQNLDSIRELLRVSPGSLIVLRGHVDNARVEEFRRAGPPVLREMTLKATQLSKERADEVLKRLVERHVQVEKRRLESVGVGWDEPVGSNSDENRRVEVQWFLVE
ncbi:MAG TPA: OmpA family protein [Tepidisphaeraceae bacterium]|nr:OmpA family protein [Tepidisphaeraceae bacterium]